MSATAVADSRTIVIPRRLGAYRIAAKIGKGGMNHVFRAVHGVLNREVALKVLPPHHRADRERMLRFKREARAGAAVDHPNVATCFDAGRHGDWCYVAMELIPGGDLEAERERRGGRLSERLAIALTRDTAYGLEAVHAADLVHRDVKPANILLGANLTPKLADFGIAICPHEQHDAEVIGSPAYMAPEQIAGHPVDARSDIYALAATCFHLVTGERPFRRNLRAIGRAPLAPEAAPSCRALRPGLSAGLDALLRRALDPQPQRRPASARAFAEALDRLLHAGPSAPVAAPSGERPADDLVLACF
ncbi:MAG: serine/threonine-protein kinase [Planctomycetota bacterium]